MDIRETIDLKLKKLKGSSGLFYHNLVTDEAFEVLSGQDDDVFEAASVIKLWIMSCAFEKENLGLIKWDEKITLREEDMVPCPGLPDYREDALNGELSGDMFPESGVLNYLGQGTTLTIRDLMRLMILISDNTATNILIDILGKDEINQHIRSLGAERTVLERKLFDTSEEVRGKENLFSLKEAADLYQMMYRGELVSHEASREMLKILQNQQNTYKLPFYIRRLPIAHKTGEDTGIENDCGIVFSDEPFIFCFASNGTDEPEAVRTCQDIAKILVG
ncbi:MAG: serine hydrolase [Firmicutes bacterium]|nr:serine hydrolase [Bacillota bacterium]MBQ5441388.1 serine hydrolase [Bacillota bacterium]